MSSTAPAPVVVRTAGDAIQAALDAIANLTVYRGRVVDPPTYADGSVKNYAVLYDTPGQRYPSRVGSKRDRLAGIFQVTCVGRDTPSCLWTVDRVALALTGLRLTVPGRTKPATIREDEANRAQLVIPDEDVDPARFFVPLFFVIRV